MTSAANRVYWITGLSGAGKSTLCRSLAEALRTPAHPVIVLDGDELREVLDSQGGHGREARLALAFRYARLFRLLSAQGVDVAIGTISMFREVQEWNRQNIPGYVEIYLRVPLEELRRRDPKGIYRRADAGELRDVAGIDLMVDEPRSPDLLVEFSPEQAPEAVLREVLTRLRSRGILP